MYLPFDNFENSKRALKFIGTVDDVFILISDKFILQWMMKNKLSLILLLHTDWYIDTITL